MLPGAPSGPSKPSNWQSLVWTARARIPWAIEIKRGSAPKVSRGFAIACADLDAERAFVVHGGRHRYPMGDGVEAIGLPEMAALLRDW